MAFPQLPTEEGDAHGVTGGAPASRGLQSKAGQAEVPSWWQGRDSQGAGPLCWIPQLAVPHKPFVTPSWHKVLLQSSHCGSQLILQGHAARAAMGSRSAPARSSLSPGKLRTTACLQEGPHPVPGGAGGTGVSGCAACSVQGREEGEWGLREGTMHRHEPGYCCGL